MKDLIVTQFAHPPKASATTFHQAQLDVIISKLERLLTSWALVQPLSWTVLLLSH